MSLKDSIKPISYLKANAAKVIKDISENGETLYITQNGEAKVVVQSITGYEKTKDTLSMLKILSLSSENLRKGKYRQSKDVFSDLKKKIRNDKIWKYTVYFIFDAEKDLKEIYEYVSLNDSKEKAMNLIDRLEKLCLS